VEVGAALGSGGMVAGKVMAAGMVASMVAWLVTAANGEEQMVGEQLAATTAVRAEIGLE